jgi:hypothetical protein
MGIFRSTDPTTWDDVDGIVIAESAPSPNVQGVAANIAILVGQFQRGEHDLVEVGSIGEIHELFGKSLTHAGNLALKNKKFGRLKIVRVEATSSAKATKAFQSSTTDRITFTAKHKGAYGNNVKVTIADGTDTGKKYTIQDLNDYAVLPTEVYDNIEIADIDSSTFAASNLVDVTVNSAAAEPSNAAATSLAGGSDGSVADADYEAAIAKCEVEAAGNILFLDDYNATRNGYLKQHAADTQDKMVIVCGLEDDDVSDAISDVASYRDADGRIIYAYPWVKTSINGASVYQQPACWYASLLSQIAPNIDPAYTANTQYLAGITGLKLGLSRASYIQLKDAGISAFENDADIGFKIKSGVVTQIADSAKLMISRRRMADFLTASAARFLKAYQNAINSKSNRTAVKAAILAFIERMEQEQMLPRDADVRTGLAKLVDTESMNTDTTIAQGFFKILWKQRLFSSMRYIVIQAEIGESVVVTEGE